MGFYVHHMVSRNDYNLGTSYQGKIGANVIAFSNGVTNGFVSDSRGWRPDDYFITMHRDQN